MKKLVQILIAVLMLTSVQAIAQKKASETGYGTQQFLINGGFDFCQRSCSYSGTTPNGYVAFDRWYTLVGDSGARTITRVASDLPEASYFARLGRTAGSGIEMYQTIETANTVRLRSKLATLSFYARVGTGFSCTPQVQIVSSTTVDCGYNTACSSTTDVISTVQYTTTTSWKKFSFTGTVPQSAATIRVRFINNGCSGSAANDHIDFANVMLNTGDRAAPFALAGGDIQGELAKCQRYYEKVSSTGLPATGFNTSIAIAHWLFKVTKRNAPSTTSCSGGALVGNTLNNNVSSYSSYVPTTDGLYVDAVSSGLTGAAAYNLRNMTCYADAEL